MAKKRTSLDSLLDTTNDALTSNSELEPENELKASHQKIENTKDKLMPKKAQKMTSAAGNKSEIVKQTVYLPLAVHEQLRQLAFEERKKMHDYLVEGLDRVFKNRGLKPYTDLSGESSR